MELSRKLGILIFTGVPAIIGGGVTYAAFENYIAVGLFEAALIASVLFVISRGKD